MMFRRCCPPYGRQPHPHTCRMTGQGDGRTARRCAVQQAPQGHLAMVQQPPDACRCQAKQPCSLQPSRAQLIASIAKEEMGIADLLAAEAQRLMRGSQAAAAGEMMAVGQSVRQTLEAIIDLEHVLLEKLELTLGECMLHMQ